MKTVAICLSMALCLALCACGNKGSLVLPSPAMVDEAPPAPTEPVEAQAAAPADDAAIEPDESDEPIPEPPPADDDGNG